jgi:hypothetical protein
MTICAVIDSNNQLVNTIVAEPTDLAPEGCTLIEIPNGYYWDGVAVSLMPEVIDNGN